MKLIVQIFRGGVILKDNDLLIRWHGCQAGIEGGYDIIRNDLIAWDRISTLIGDKRGVEHDEAGMRR